jgi:hypothetical protein
VYHEWRANTRDSLNRYIKELTGAAMSNTEAGRITGAFPNEDDSHTAYISKMRNVVRQTLAIQKRAQQYLSAGAVAPSGDGWDRIAEPPVSAGEVEAFMAKMGLSAGPVEKPAAPGGGPRIISVTPKQ